MSEQVTMPLDQWERVAAAARWGYEQHTAYPGSVSLLLAHAADRLTANDLVAIGVRDE